MKLKKIIIYDEVSIPEIRISEITNFLKDNFAVDVIIKDSFFQELDKDEIKSLSKIRIFNIYKKYTPCEPEQKSIIFEEKLCHDSSIMEQTTKIEEDDLSSSDIEILKKLAKENKIDYSHESKTHQLLISTNSHIGSIKLEGPDVRINVLPKVFEDDVNWEDTNIFLDYTSSGNLDYYENAAHFF